MATQLTLAYAQEQRPAQAGESPVRRLVRDLPAADRPLYRLEQHGSGVLSNAELLALVLGRADALDLAHELLVRFGSLHRLARANQQALTRVRGIGPVQAARLAAALELSRRAFPAPQMLSRCWRRPWPRSTGKNCGSSCWTRVTGSWVFTPSIKAA
jgi:hypothetical protein